jgi:glutathione S-transferase
MSNRLYGVPGSHPTTAAALMLERKGIAFKRFDLTPAMHRRALRLLGFAGNTVPALKLDGRRLQGTREIARTLDEVRPEPPLFPSDSARRARVEEAEQWGDEKLQPPARRISLWALSRDGTGVRSFLEGARTGMPVWMGVRTAGPFVKASARNNEADEAAAQADVAALPALLEHIDGLIAEGVLGGPEPTAADYQIAPSVRLLMALDDLRPSIEGRPAGALAERIAPNLPGRIPPVLPADWLGWTRAPGVAGAG